MPSNVTLLPCPFCGGEPMMDGEDSTWAKLCRVRCRTCNANRMIYTETRAEAAEMWNSRTASPSASAQTEDVVSKAYDAGYIVGKREGAASPSVGEDTR